MEQKIKFVFIGLAVTLTISLLLTLQMYGSKQVLVRQRDELKQENAALLKKVEESRQNAKQLEDRLSLLNKELDRVSKEKESLQQKFDLLGKTRDELVEQIKLLEARKLEAPKAQTLAQPPTEDTYWAGLLKTNKDLALQLESLRSELKLSLINNEAVQREKSALELDISNLARESQDLKRQLEYNQQIMDSIAQELVRERKDKFQIESSLKTIKSENDLLRRQLKTLNSRKIDLERKLASLQEENKHFDTRFQEIETLLKDKLFEIDNLKKQLELSGVSPQRIKPEEPKESKAAVELPPIVVHPPTETVIQQTSTLGGKVLAVNRDNNFVIIDLGQEQGIKIGNTFSVYRADKAIAHIEVIQARKSISACDIKKETAPIVVGDTVR